MANCCVLGLGYIGLPTSAILANHGHKVLGVDIKQDVVDIINSGKIHIIEPQLEEIVEDVVSKGNLKASLYPDFADIFIIAVPTPFKEKESEEDIPMPNIDFVLKAASSIAPFLKSGNLVILESTSPVGTTEKVSKVITDESNLSLEEFHICYCPERVLPGRIIHELIFNDRVIGGINKKSSEICKTFYSTFCKGNLKITSTRTAEMVKLSENAYRDVNIAFANELSMICSQLDIDVHELISISNQHPRVNILNPGCGVGGHCIAVDPWFIISNQPKLSKLTKTARIVNDSKSEWVIKKIKEKAIEIEKSLTRSIKIGCMGISFKPDVDDLRESPALAIVQYLINSNYETIICEPNLSSYNEFCLVSENYLIEKSDLIVFLVAHKSFKSLNIKNKPILDFCGIEKSFYEKNDL